jgi:hypothetical protein
MFSEISREAVYKYVRSGTLQEQVTWTIKEQKQNPS